MSTFSDQSFDAKNYNSNRPSYSSTFFNEALMVYHTGDTKLAIDIGSGSGQAAVPLSRYFEQVIGTDLSETMVTTATSLHREISNLKFIVANAENLSFLGDGTADMMTCAQCAHWFDHPVFFKEAARVLKPGGTLAIWGYGDPYLVDYPETDELLQEFGFSDNGLGPYWEQPGKDLIRNLLREVEFPTALFGDIQVVEFERNCKSSKLEIIRNFTVEDYRAYITTWSSYHTWKKQHPGEPDIADAFIHKLMAMQGWTKTTPIRLQWSTVYKFARRLP